MTTTGPVRVLAIAGSTRSGSLNRMLLAEAVRALETAGAAVTAAALEDFPMPLYQGDLEAREGMPPQARRLKALLADHHALLLVSPENNASVPALLKNTLDWLSRPDGGQNGLVAFQGKVALLMAASPGSLGGLRGLAHLRQILQALSVLVLAEQLAVPRAHEQFDGQGRLQDPKLLASIAGLARRLVSVCARLNT